MNGIESNTEYWDLTLHLFSKRPINQYRKTKLITHMHSLTSKPIVDFPTTKSSLQVSRIHPWANLYMTQATQIST
jgi:hypothetical protein